VLSLYGIDAELKGNVSQTLYSSLRFIYVTSEQIPVKLVLQRRLDVLNSASVVE
jgi:hypothetical protein